MRTSDFFGCDSVSLFTMLASERMRTGPVSPAGISIFRDGSDDNGIGHSLSNPVRSVFDLFCLALFPFQAPFLEVQPTDIE